MNTLEAISTGIIDNFDDGMTISIGWVMHLEEADCRVRES